MPNWTGNNKTPPLSFTMTQKNHFRKKMEKMNLTNFYEKILFPKNKFPNQAI